MESLNSFLNATSSWLPSYVSWIFLVLGLAFTMYNFGGAFLWSFVVLGFLSLVGCPAWLFLVALVPCLIACIKPLRMAVLSKPIMNIIVKNKLLPQVSDTEKAALNAGTVWAEAEYFSGKPNHKMLSKEPYPELTAEEQAFMDGPVKELCEMADDWTIHQERKLNDDIWAFMKKEKFFGMIIPKKYGGLGFSALAHSEVVCILASRSVPLCVTVMVPNSLGPAELLHHYGTQEQKDYYLPRLADAVEIPCFALTEPEAGSDAGSITSSGILYKDSNGEIKIKLNWNKRWITLAATSTVLGLAFQLYDPEHLLGDKDYLGITCALIPSDSKGVEIGKRHDPLGVPFYNCPTRGEDVVIGINDIVGAQSGLGKGWVMLMECLAAGRGISLPAQSTGGSMKALRYTTAHAAIRKQFGLPIYKFEGVAEPMARMTAHTYALEAARRYTCGALDSGKKPPVITAIAKYFFTETSRVVANDAMDVVGGSAISEGPRNPIANMYKAIPISITVEGANILTRTLIIFGQGLLRGHPYVKHQIDAIEKNSVSAFDKAFWSHISHVTANKFRAFFMGATKGYLIGTHSTDAKLKRYYQRLTWASSTFSFLADTAMGTLGGSLKLKEQLAGRFADTLSNMYFITATLRRYEADGKKKEHLAIVQWLMEDYFYNINKALTGIIDNLGVPFVTGALKCTLGTVLKINPIGKGITDRLNLKVTKIGVTAGDARESLMNSMFMSEDSNDHMKKYEEAFHAQAKANALHAKIKKHLKSKRVKRKLNQKLFEELASEGFLTSAELEQLNSCRELVYDAIQVDAFTQEEYLERKSPDQPYLKTPIKGAPGPSKTTFAPQNKVNSDIQA